MKNIPIGIGILQVALAVIVPIATLWAEKRWKIIRTISPVALCYGFGMFLGNQGLIEFSRSLALTVCALTVALAIPLLLFSVNIIAWLRLAGRTLLAFSFCIISVLVVATAAHFIFRNQSAETAKMAGMLTGVYIGGTPNMNAIGLAVGASSETFIMLNTADLIVSFSYFLFLITAAGKTFGYFLPRFPYPDGAGPSEKGDAWDDDQGRMPSFLQMLPGLALTVAIVFCGLVLKNTVPEKGRDMVAILTITSLAVISSFFPKVRALRGTQQMGQYFLLIFCLVIGITTDLSKLFHSSLVYLFFTLFIVATGVTIHYTLCALFRIDRDTAIITSTAGIFSVPFVGPVAMSLRNKEIVFSGIACALVGYAVANYLGIILTWILS